MSKRKHDIIESLRFENDLLHQGIELREEINDAIKKDKDTQVYIIKHLTFLILYMESLDAIARNNNNPTSKIISNAINHFKQELTNGFYGDGFDLYPNNTTNSKDQ